MTVVEKTKIGVDEMADNLSEAFDKYRWNEFTPEAQNLLKRLNKDVEIHFACKYWDAKEDVFRVTFEWNVCYIASGEKWVRGSDLSDIRGSKIFAFMITERSSCYYELFCLNQGL